MLIAKATDDDFERVSDFLHACENGLIREKWSLDAPEDQWQSWDDDDPDKIRILQIRKRVAQVEGIEPREVDHRIVMYEWLQEKFGRCANRWHRVTMAGVVLIENVSDPTSRYLEFYPGFECYHVAPEQ